MKSSSRPADDELNRLVALGITRQQVEPGDDCLDPEVLASYADGGLSVAERTTAEAHLARCRDCRRALALQVESDPLVASALATATAEMAVRSFGPADGSPSGTTSEALGASGSTTSGVRGVSGWPRVVKSAKMWLPLAAALVLATGLWLAFDRSRQRAPYVTSAPAQLSARNESAAAKQAAAKQALQEPAAAPRVEPPRPAPDGDANPAGVPPQGEALRASSAGRAGSAALSKDASRTDAIAPQPSASARARTAPRDEFAPAARPNAETDRRTSPSASTHASAPASASAPAPAPPPSLAAALADAAPARAGAEAGKEAQAKVAGQLAGAAPASPAAASPAAPQAPAPDQAAVANQNATQQTYAINQQTGPMANLNIAPPPAKADEQRRQPADRSKSERNENEKSSGGPSGAKSSDNKFAKAEEPEPKSLARAKAAPENAAVGAREISEAVTIATAAPSLVLRSVDGVRWWRIRAPSTIEGSTDRGGTWTVEYSDPAVRLVRGAPAAKGGCWIIGANGLVLRTRPNGGWERVTQPTTRNLVTLAATDHLIATVTDDQGRTYRTTDGGATWR